MTARLVLVLNQKGGSAKTTTAVNLAGAAQRRGHKVLLVDADFQATATKWAARAAEDAMDRLNVIGLAAAKEKIAQAVKPFIGDYDLIVVDCPPSVESLIPQKMLMVADLAIVPVTPKPGDLWATTDLLEMAERMRETVNEALQVRLLPSNVVPNTALTKHALNEIANMRESAPPFRTMLHQRTAYAESMLIGDSVHGLGSQAKQAIREVESLFDEVAVLLQLPHRQAKTKGKATTVVEAA